MVSFTDFGGYRVRHCLRTQPSALGRKATRWPWTSLPCSSCKTLKNTDVDERVRTATKKLF